MSAQNSVNVEGSNMVQVRHKGSSPHLQAHNLRDQTPQESSSYSELNSPSYSPLENDKQSTKLVTATHSDIADNSLPYVPLSPKFMDYLCWSNDPDDMYLETYFDKSKPNLSNDYEVVDLKPVVKEISKDRFILRDPRERFYLWDAWDCELLRVPDKYTKGFVSTEEIVDNIIMYKSYIEEEGIAVWRNRKHD
jgi:hypothetical protein